MCQTLHNVCDHVYKNVLRGNYHRLDKSNFYTIWNDTSVNLGWTYWELWVSIVDWKRQKENKSILLKFLILRLSLRIIKNPQKTKCSGLLLIFLGTQ